MKALLYTGPKSLSYQEVDQPVSGDGDVLIRVESVGICGSDMHGYLGHDARRVPPLILGHEAAGTIVEGPRASERVTVNPLVTCMVCEACLSGRENICANRQLMSIPPRQGSFADFITVPERNLVTVPDHVGSDQAALVEPLACGWHAIRLAVEAIRHKSTSDISLLVLGGGAIGVGVALCAQAFGITDVLVVEPNEDRFDYLKKRGDFPVTAAIEEGSYDLVVDAVGYDATRKTASQHVKPGGIIVHIGLGGGEGGFDIRHATLQEVTFIGTYTYTMQDFKDTAAALYEGKLGAVDWIECRSLSEGAQAFSDLLDRKVAASKIVLKP